ncbi:hypothetical protein HMPREF9294_1551 [Porphyromonas asaccharolytica PR426713P-I]|nr:hypothetical protein HMPREF9294_1551 [Porphyromonas asaccharolytica PR426713P-I]
MVAALGAKDQTSKEYTFVSGYCCLPMLCDKPAQRHRL